MMTDNEINNIAQGDALKGITALYKRKLEHAVMVREENRINDTFRRGGGFPSPDLYISQDEREYVRDVGWLLSKVAKLVQERDALRAAAQQAREALAEVETIYDDRQWQHYCPWCNEFVEHAFAKAASVIKHKDDCRFVLALAALDAALDKAAL